MGKKINFAVIQPKLSENVEEALKKAKKYLNMLAGSEVDIIIFPESWLLLEPYKRLEKQAVWYTKIINLLKKYAKKLNAYILAGALYKREEYKYYIVSPLICYDVNFPEIARKFLLLGADLLLNPSRIRGKGYLMWHLYVKARALENRLPIIATNVYYPGKYYGMSIALNLQLDEKEGIVVPIQVLNIGSKEGVGVSSISLNGVKKERIKRLNEVKEIIDIYSIKNK